MNKEQKQAVVEEVARELREADAVFAVDYRGISVKDSADLRAQLSDAGARFRVVKNRLTQRAADEAGAEMLKEYLEGPTALTFVPADGGDAALAAKALAVFRREHGIPEFKGGAMEGRPLTAADIEAISRLPARDVLYGQLVGVTASPITGLVRSLNALLSGLAVALGQVQERGLVGDGEAAAEEGAAEEAGDAAEGDTEAEGEAGAAEEDAPDEGGTDEIAEAATTDDETEPVATPDAPDEQPDEEIAEAATDESAADDPSVAPAEEAPGDPVAEAATAEQEQEDQETSE